MNDNFYSHASGRLKTERVSLGLNQAEAGSQCGVSREMWGKYERGTAVPGGEVLFSFAAAGADVQYILTGVRSSVALVPDERLLLERYRASPQELKDAALRVLLNGEQTQPQSAKFNIHGDVGQSVGTQTASHFTIDMRKERKKKE